MILQNEHNLLFPTLVVECRAARVATAEKPGQQEDTILIFFFKSPLQSLDIDNIGHTL